MRRLYDKDIKQLKELLTICTDEQVSKLYDMVATEAVRREVNKSRLQK